MTIHAAVCSLALRFAEGIERRNGHWLWTKHRHPSGYARVLVAGKEVSAARAAWWMASGEWPTGKVWRHCDEPACLNPAHHRIGEKPRPKIRRPHKLTADDVRAIRVEHERGATMRALAAAYGVSAGAISHIVHRVNWRHVA